MIIICAMLNHIYRVHEDRKRRPQCVDGSRSWIGLIGLIGVIGLIRAVELTERLPLALCREGLPVDSYFTSLTVLRSNSVSVSSFSVPCSRGSEAVRARCFC